MRFFRGIESFVASKSVWFKIAAPVALSVVVVSASCTKSDTEDPGMNMGEHSCLDPYEPDPRDATMSGELVHVVTDVGDPNDPTDDKYDVALPQEMVDWLYEQNWVQEHGDWHNVRRWDQACMQSGSGICASAAILESRGLKAAAIQEGEAGDGYAFLVMHRHMIRGFKQAFPKHADDMLRGFKHVPLTQDDPENPINWVNIHWNDDQLASIKLLQDIENNLDLFKDEDDLGKWIQLIPGGLGGPCGPPGGFPDGGFPPPPSGAGGFGGMIGGGCADGQGGQGGFGGFGAMGGMGGMGAMGGMGGQGGSSARPPGGIHGGLHGQWAVVGSKYFLANNNVNIPVLAFWRLHGWIDDMWERYRVAKGIGEDDPTYKAEMLAQCEEMHTLGLAKPPEDTTTTNETGVFAEKVAPIFKAYCAGCHDSVGASKGLVLTSLAPSKIREGLVNIKAIETDLDLIEPNAPEKSWLYRKITADFAGVQCVDCSTAMPLAGSKPTAAEVETIRAWIASGATAN